MRGMGECTRPLPTGGGIGWMHTSVTAIISPSKICDIMKGQEITTDMVFPLTVLTRPSLKHMTQWKISYQSPYERMQRRDRYANTRRWLIKLSSQFWNINGLTMFCYSYLLRLCGGVGCDPQASFLASVTWVQIALKGWLHVSTKG